MFRRRPEMDVIIPDNPEILGAPNLDLPETPIASRKRFLAQLGSIAIMPFHNQAFQGPNLFYGDSTSGAGVGFFLGAILGGTTESMLHLAGKPCNVISSGGRTLLLGVVGAIIGSHFLN
ncbi:MAG: hypothetical protein Q7R77_00770 [Candidatus Daviesbacteria bacterium]|nr:hypothetical protein [Candidatus Daviesbacteria bacterium]